MIHIKCLENPRAHWPHMKPGSKIVWFDLPAKVRDYIIDMCDFETQWTFYVCSELSTIAHMPQNSIRSLHLKDDRLQINLANRTVHRPLIWHHLQFYDVTRIVERIIEKNLSSLQNLVYYNEWHFSKKDLSKTKVKNLRTVDINFGQHGVINSGFNYEQLAQVSENATIRHLPLKAELLARFQAENINLKFAQTTSTEINKYLRMFASGQTSGKVKKIHLEMESGNYFYPETISHNLDVLGFKSDRESTTFALPSSENTCRIAVVKVANNTITMEAFSRQEFEEHKEHFEKYGTLVNDYLKDSFVFLGHDDLTNH